MVEKPAIVLFHGAIGDHTQMLRLAALLEEKFTVHCPDFPGHGSDTGTCPPVMEELANNIDQILAGISQSPVYAFGYSMGGYAAAFFAAKYKGRIKALTTYGTKWHWDEEVARKETAMLDAGKMMEKVPEFARKLAAQHTGMGWIPLLAATRSIMEDLGKRETFYRQILSQLNVPMLILRGEKDNMVGSGEGIWLTEMHASIQYRELEAQKHAFDQVNADFLVTVLQQAGIYDVE